MGFNPRTREGAKINDLDLEYTGYGFNPRTREGAKT